MLAYNLCACSKSGLSAAVLRISCLIAAIVASLFSRFELFHHLSTIVGLVVCFSIFVAPALLLKYLVLDPFSTLLDLPLRHTSKIIRTQTLIHTLLLGGARSLLSGRQGKRAPPPLSPEPSADSSLLRLLALLPGREFPFQRRTECFWIIRSMFFSDKSLVPISAGFSLPRVLTSCSRCASVRCNSYGSLVAEVSCHRLKIEPMRIVWPSGI